MTTDFMVTCCLCSYPAAYVDKRTDGPTALYIYVCQNLHETVEPIHEVRPRENEEEARA